MIVGTQDRLTLRANREVLRRLRGDVELHLIRGAGHTFEEPGALGAVGRRMERWLMRHHAAPSRRWWSFWRPNA